MTELDNWDLMAGWERVLPPSRPSTVQLRSIVRAISHVDRTQAVAVLGSTPEFRDLLHECGFSKIVLLERNLDFHKLVSALRVHTNPEEVIVGDWINTLPGLQRRFAIVLSDLTSGNIPYEKRDSFYQLIAQSLLPNGLFIDKVLTHPIPHLALDDITQRYSDQPLNWMVINHFSCEALFCSELLDINETVDSALFYKIIAEKTNHPRLSAMAFLAKRITPPGCTWWYGRKWDRLLPGYCPALQVVESREDESGSPYFGRVRHFVHVRPS